MAATNGPPLTGSWGGDRANLQLAQTGGRMTMDCASGTFSGAVTPNAKGHFVVEGLWEAYQPGPQEADAPAGSVPAVFEGHVTGDTLHLIVKADGKQQRLTLEKGRQVKLVRCL